jgi:hypothetical protein
VAINRRFWLEPFFKESFPNWNCPRCDIGVLRPVDGSFQYWESAESREAGRNYLMENRQSFDANTMLGGDASEYRYSVLLKCNNQTCMEYVASCGSGQVVEEYDRNTDEFNYPNGFLPQYFYPSMRIFPIPKECPKKVRDEIESSFKLFFSDPPASVNYIRKAVDEILTHKGVRRFVNNHTGQKIRIALHDRIIGFRSSNSDTANSLLAMKWLGNEGSHTDKITKNDVLDAYEILESVLDDLYVGYRKSLDKKVLKINKSRKPLHPST